MKPPKCAGRNTACAFWDSGILLYSHGMKQDENLQITEIFGYVSSAVYDTVALNDRFCAHKKAKSWHTIADDTGMQMW